jgi:L-rhamnose mutarotase
VERICLCFEVRPGTEEEFERRHREAWPEFLAALREAGIRNYSQFRRGRTIICYGECEPDVETAFGALGATDVAARWGAWFVPEIMPSPAVDDGGRPDAWREIWHVD